MSVLTIKEQAICATEEGEMKKEEKEIKKNEYTKPLLIKHKKLKDITAGAGSPNNVLGCTKSF